MEEGRRGTSRESRVKDAESLPKGSGAASVMSLPEARQNPAKMTPQEYLDRYSVTPYMKDLLTVLLENRPEHPIEFIADYFTCAVNGAAPIFRSYRYIRLTQRNRLAFMDNLAQAYSIMTRSSETPGAGLTGAAYLRLLHMICSDFPPDIILALTQVLDKKENETISFPVFVAGINTCLLYEEFFEHAESLFNTCDTGNTGRVDQHVFMAIIRQVNSQPMSQEGAENWNIPSSVLLDDVSSTLSTSEKVDGKSMITFRDFVAAIIKVFVARDEIQ